MEDSPAFGAIVAEDDHPVLLDRLAVGFALGFALGGRAIFADLTGLDDAVGELDTPFPGRERAIGRGRVAGRSEGEHEDGNGGEMKAWSEHEGLLAAMLVRSSLNY